MTGIPDRTGIREDPTGIPTGKTYLTVKKENKVPRFSTCAGPFFMIYLWKFIQVISDRIFIYFGSGAQIQGGIFVHENRICI